MATHAKNYGSYRERDALSVTSVSSYETARDRPHGDYGSFTTEGSEFQSLQDVNDEDDTMFDEVSTKMQKSMGIFPEEGGGEESLARYKTLHPDNWSPTDVLQWVYAYIDSQGLDLCDFQGEKWFKEMTGKQLHQKTKNDFILIEPGLGAKLYDHLHAHLPNELQPPQLDIFYGEDDSLSNIDILFDMRPEDACQPLCTLDPKELADILERPIESGSISTDTISHYTACSEGSMLGSRQEPLNWTQLECPMSRESHGSVQSSHGSLKRSRDSQGSLQDAHLSTQMSQHGSQGSMHGSQGSVHGSQGSKRGSYGSVQEYIEELHGYSPDVQCLPEMVQGSQGVSQGSQDVSPCPQEMMQDSRTSQQQFIYPDVKPCLKSEIKPDELDSMPEHMLDQYYSYVKREPFGMKIEEPFKQEEEGPFDLSKTSPVAPTTFLHSSDCYPDREDVVLHRLQARSYRSQLPPPPHAHHATPPLPPAESTPMHWHTPSTAHPPPGALPPHAPSHPTCHHRQPQQHQQQQLEDNQHNRQKQHHQQHSCYPDPREDLHSMYDHPHDDHHQQHPQHHLQSYHLHPHQKQQQQQQPQEQQQTPVVKTKRGPGRPPKIRDPEEIRRAQARQTNGPKLTEWMLRLLDSEHAPDLVRWEDQDRGVFRILQSKKVAGLWGDAKNNKSMTFEKLSRAIRDRRKEGYFANVPKEDRFPKKLCFRFGAKSGIRKPHSEWVTSVTSDCR